MIEPFQPLRYSGSGFVALATLAQISRANWIGSGSFIRLACLNGGLGGGATARRVFLAVGALATVYPASPAPYPRCMVDSVALLRLRSAIDVRLDIEMEYGEDHHVAA